MRNPNSLQEVAEIHSLLEDIKKEYTQGIRGVLKKMTQSFLEISIQFQNYKKSKLTVG